MRAWSSILEFLKGLALLGEKMKRDEIFQSIRWLNLGMGIINMYYYMLGAGVIILSIAMLNIGAWIFTRKN
tara:strand:- start:7686 stop:7898 length:213 start_codon:yes stop_codon:yes gene_type:complete